MREMRPKGQPPRKLSDAARPDQQPKWLAAGPVMPPRKNPTLCTQLENQILFMRLKGPPALTREEREAIQAEWRDKVLGSRSRVHAFHVGHGPSV